MKHRQLLPFSSNECVEIKTKEQYNSVCHELRNPKSIENELEETIYFENARSIHGCSSIGIIYEPIGTWSREKLRIVSFEEATKEV